MRDKIWVLGLKLFAIAAVAGLRLARPRAHGRADSGAGVIAADAAARGSRQRRYVYRTDRAEGLSEAYAGYEANGKLVGKTGKVVTKGYGGEVEVPSALMKRNHHGRVCRRFEVR